MLSLFPQERVHAILDGILIAEIQQNSNTTYRIYDWNRIGKDGTPRELHVKEALEVVAFGKKLPEIEKTSCRNERIILRSQFFSIDEIDLDGMFAKETDGKTFNIIMNLTGKAKIKYESCEVELGVGDSVLMPALLGKYTMEGHTKLLITWI